MPETTTTEQKPTKRTCSIKGCDGKHYARGWCRPHWNRWDRYGDPQAPTRRTDKDVPSPWIAEKTGYSRQGIHRMRTEPDSRPPTMARMKRLEDTLGWPQADQFAAHQEGRWIEAFETYVGKLYEKEATGA